MDDCIFCKIVKKEIPAKILYESDNIIAFPDINPSADTHIIIIPKEHIKEVLSLGTEHADLLVEIYQTVRELVIENNLTDKLYRVVVNGGQAQHILHLHFHLLGGKIRKMV